MAQRKSKPTKKKLELPKPKVELSKISIGKNMPKIGASYALLLKTLTTLFLVIWIAIGIFALVIIVAGIRNGAYSGMFTQPQQQTNTSTAPSEADLPGVGTVNVDCVKSALSSDAIQKILDEQSAASLTNAEKAKLEPCIISKAEATPSATPSQ